MLGEYKTLQQRANELNHALDFNRDRNRRRKDLSLDELSKIYYNNQASYIKSQFKHVSLFQRAMDSYQKNSFTGPRKRGCLFMLCWFNDDKSNLQLNKKGILQMLISKQRKFQQKYDPEFFVFEIEGIRPQDQNQQQQFSLSQVQQFTQVPEEQKSNFLGEDSQLFELPNEQQQQQHQQEEQQQHQQEEQQQEEQQQKEQQQHQQEEQQQEEFELFEQPNDQRQQLVQLILNQKEEQKKQQQNKISHLVIALIKLTKSSRITFANPTFKYKQTEVLVVTRINFEEFQRHQDFFTLLDKNFLSQSSLISKQDQEDAKQFSISLQNQKIRSLCTQQDPRLIISDTNVPFDKIKQVLNMQKTFQKILNPSQIRNNNNNNKNSKTTIMTQINILNIHQGGSVSSKDVYQVLEKQLLEQNQKQRFNAQYNSNFYDQNHLQEPAPKKQEITNEQQLQDEEEEEANISEDTVSFTNEELLSVCDQISTNQQEEALQKGKRWQSLALKNKIYNKSLQKEFKKMWVNQDVLKLFSRTGIYNHIQASLYTAGLIPQQIMNSGLLQQSRNDLLSQNAPQMQSNEQVLDKNLKKRQDIWPWDERPGASRHNQKQVKKN